MNPNNNNNNNNNNATTPLRHIIGQSMPRFERFLNSSPDMSDAPPAIRGHVIAQTTSPDAISVNERSSMVGSRECAKGFGRSSTNTGADSATPLLAQNTTENTGSGRWLMNDTFRRAEHLCSSPAEATVDDDSNARPTSSMSFTATELSELMVRFFSDKSSQ